MLDVILVGYGEVGQAIYEVFKEFHAISIHDPYCESKRTVKRGKKADLLVITIPYNDKFVNIVKAYQLDFPVKSTLVFSTTKIGTCNQLNAIHSPVEGKHPDLATSIRKGKRWIGGIDAYVLNFFTKANFKLADLKIVPDPSWTEFLKLRSTSLYGVNIEFARYSKDIADNLEMPFNLIQDFDKNYNELYKKLKMPEYSRYILNAPKGDIGGHCIVPNAEILNKQYPNALLGEIIKKK